MTETQPKLYVTRTGLPLHIQLHWPFKPSASGADFWVIHSELSLVSDPTLNAMVAVNLATTLREALGGNVGAEHIESAVLACIRKEVDKHQIEFLRSSKLVPIAFGSRHYNLKRNQWTFGEFNSDDASTLLQRKTFWLHRSGERAPMADPGDALYLGTTPDGLRAEARKLASAGLIQLEGDLASATPALLAKAAEIESAAAKSLEELQLKHAFERG